MVGASLKHLRVEIGPELCNLCLIVGACTSAEGVDRCATDIAHLIIREALLFKNTIYMKFCPLEGTLIHALLLNVDYFSIT